MLYLALLTIGLLIVWLFEACRPVRAFMKWETYTGSNHFTYTQPTFDSTKKTVIIMANNDGTEVFDMMAPFYLFNATEKANVYIVAGNKYPVTAVKGFFVLPHYSLEEFDVTGIRADIIVIPNLSTKNVQYQDEVIVPWIKKHYQPTTTMLSVCDGSKTAAATGIYDGKPLTTHASDYEAIKRQCKKPGWVKNVSVTSSENLFSTAGVSNAVEGCLAVIDRVFGKEIMLQVLKDINYPHHSPKMEHQSIAINFNNKLTVGNKVIFRKNKRIGVLLQNGLNEFDLASVTDTYNRTFPASIESFATDGKPVISKYGLTIIPTSNSSSGKLDELHVLHPALFSQNDRKLYEKAEVVEYDKLQQRYIIDRCLNRIGHQYGRKFQHITKLLLDYN